MRRLFALIFVSFALASCLPEKGNEQSDCGTNKVFDSTKRACISLANERSTPVGTFGAVTINEDAGVTIVTLTYSDKDKDLATGCTISSASTDLDGNGSLPVNCNCVAGLCRATITPDTNFNGLAEFRYRLTDIDGLGVEKIVGVTVVAVDDAPVNNLAAISPLSGVTILEDTSQIWTLAYTDQESDKATACNIQNTTSKFSITSTCACNVSGVCRFTLKGLQDLYGVGESFTFQVFANGRWSTPSTVFFNIGAVNDAPLLAANVTYIIEEGNPPALVNLLIGSGTGNGTDYISGSGNGFATDVDNTQSQLLYSLVSGPSSGVATLAGCLGATNDLDCTYILTDPNYNNDYLNDKITIPVTGADILRVRAVEAGDHTANPFILVINPAGSGSGLTLSSVVGRTVTIAAEQDVTSAQEIKELLEASPAASALLNVYLLGSVPIDATTFGTYTLTGGVNAIETIVYSVADPGGPGSGSGVVSISITPTNDAPVEPADIDLSAQVQPEDEVATIQLTPGSDVDLTDELNYRIVGSGTLSGQGVVSGCMDLDGSEGPGDLTCIFTPERNFSGLVSFDYYTNDGLADAASTTNVTFTIDPVNDNPMICQFTTFSEANECGLNHCVGSGSPVGNIVPLSHTASKAVYYYDSSSATCWKSTDSATSSDWESTEPGYIQNYVANQNDTVKVDHIRVDEGGGDAGEDSQTLELRFETDNAPLVPLSQIKVYWAGGTPLNGVLASTCTPCTLDNAGSEDGVNLKLVVTPMSAAAGVANIKVKIADDDASPRDVYYTFQIEVKTAGAIHAGWANIQSHGPKVDRDAVVLDSPYTCSFSQSKCNGGGQCKGSSSPTGVAADELNALYLNDSNPASPVCYRAKAKVTLGSIDLYARQEAPLTVEFVNDTSITSGNELIYLSGGAGGGRHILVKMRNNDTDADDIESKILGDNNFACSVNYTTSSGLSTDGNCFLSVINNGGSVKQTAPTDGPKSISVKDRYVGKYNNLIFNSSSSAAKVEFKNVSTLVGGGDETVEVKNNTLIVGFKSGVSTAAHVFTRLVAAGTTVTALTNFTYADPTQTASLVTSVAPTSLGLKSSALTWQTFQSYCAISQTDQVSACSSGSFGGPTYDLGASCIGNDAPSSYISSTDEESYYYNENNKTCYRTRQTGAATFTWDSYPATGKTTVTWKPFTVSGAGSITGYKIFRRIGDGDGDGDGEIDHPFDYTNPINIYDVGTSETSFTDSYATSRMPPVPGTVYFYEVRPIIDGVLSSTLANHRQVRILTPPQNMSFVHRWIVNENICTLMHANERDDLDSSEASSYEMKTANQFYKCKYYGPGGVSPTDHNYDIGKDLLVDTFEAGCAYTTGCTKTGGGSTTVPGDGKCIGQGDPNGDITSSAAGKLFYDRSSGVCYRSTGAGTVWTALGEGNAATIGAGTQTTYNGAHNPPAVNLTQAAANTFCGAVNAPTNIVGATLSNTVKRLPNRRHQIAYSQWPTDSNDSDINAIEEGLSLNSSSKCNSSSASGLTAFYEDAPIPAISSLFTLPGDSSNVVKSVYTGSEQTSSCVSRYGIQDAVGNVAEFLTDRFRCSGDPSAAASDENNKAFSQCAAITADNNDLDGAAYDISPLVTTEDLYKVLDDETNWGSGYSMGRKINGAYAGPCNDTNSDDICDGALTSWVIEDTSFNAGRLFIPMGLPANNLYGSALPDSAIGKSMFDIGSTNGITSGILHDDKIIINSDYIFSSVNGSGTTANMRGCGAMIAGGGWNDNSGAGVWNFELLPCYSAFGYLILDEIVFRKLTSSSAYEIDMDPCTATGTDAPGGAALWVFDNIDSGCHNSGNNGSNVGMVMEINVADYTAAASDTAAEVLDLLRADPQFCAKDTTPGNGTDEGLTLCDAFITGNQSAQLDYNKSGTDFYIDVSTETSNVREDVGFRCLVEIDSNNGADYDEDQF